MMRRILAFALLLPLAACGGLPANVVVLLPDEDGHTGRVLVHDAAGQVDLGQPLADTDLGAGKGAGAVSVAKQSDVDDSFAAVMKAMPRKPASFVLYFRSEATDILPDSRPALAAAIAAAKAESNVDISVVGHSDAAGAESYNLALSLRRAQSIRDGLVAAGIPANAIEIAYHGANNPLVPTAPGVHEPRNRRVEVTVR
jgi:adhesin transport system outer membrane protein